MSSRCATQADQATWRPSWKIGTAIMTSGLCEAPWYGWLWMKTSPSSISCPVSRMRSRIPRMLHGRGPACSGVVSLSQSSSPSASKRPAPRSSDSRMMLEKDMRIAVCAISWATALNAPPITRSVTGSSSDSGPAAVATPAARDVMPVSRTVEQSISRLPTASTRATRPGLTTVVESNW